MYYEETQLYKRITKRLEEVESDYQKMNNGRDSIVEYFRLDMGTDTEKSTRGDFFGRTIYEGTPPWAAKTMAKFFQGSLVSPTIDWLKYVMKEFSLKGIDELDIWLQDIKDHMSSVYQRSNYYQILPRYTLDGVTIGSPVFFMEEKIEDGTIKCIPQHYKHCFMFYDRFGDIEGIIVKSPTWTAKQIDEKFGGDKETREKKFSVSLSNDLQNGHWNTEHTIIKAVFKAKDPMWDREGFRKPYPKDWITVFFEEKLKPGTEDSPLETTGDFTRPFASWNYSKLENEVVSRTPAWEAIYDVMSGQQIHKTFLENAVLKTNTPKYALSDMESRLELWADGITYVNKDEYQFPPKNLEGAVGDVLFNKELSDILSQAIKRHFMLDSLMRFSDIAEKHKQPLTVYQLWKIAGENSTLLSPAVETYSKDLLGSADDRFRDIEYRAGRGPFERQRLANITDVIMSNATEIVKSIGVTAEFVGPLHRAQRLQQAVEPILSGLQTLAPLFQILPETVNIVKPYELADKIAQATDFPPDVIRTKDDYEAIVQMIREKLAQQKEFENTIEAAKASKDVSGAVDESSVLSAVAGGAT